MKQIVLCTGEFTKPGCLASFVGCKNFTSVEEPPASFPSSFSPTQLLSQWNWVSFRLNSYEIMVRPDNKVKSHLGRGDMETTGSHNSMQQHMHIYPIFSCWSSLAKEVKIRELMKDKSSESFYSFMAAKYAISDETNIQPPKKYIAKCYEPR